MHSLYQNLTTFNISTFGAKMQYLYAKSIKIVNWRSDKLKFTRLDMGILPIYGHFKGKRLCTMDFLLNFP